MEMSPDWVVSSSVGSWMSGLPGNSRVEFLCCWRARLADLFLLFLPEEPMVAEGVTRPGLDSCSAGLQS